MVLCMQLPQQSQQTTDGKLFHFYFGESHQRSSFSFGPSVRLLEKWQVQYEPLNTLSLNIRPAAGD